MNNYKYPVSKTVQWSMGQSRCVSKTCRALLQVTDGERKSPPTRRKKELSSTIKLDVSLLSQRFFFFFFVGFGYRSPRKLYVSLRIVYLARSAPWNNTTLQRVKTRGKQRKKVDRKEAESPEVQLSQRWTFLSIAGYCIYTDPVWKLPHAFLCCPFYPISDWAT